MPRKHPGTGRAFEILHHTGQWIAEEDLIREARLGSKAVPAQTVLTRVLAELEELGWPVLERADAAGRAFRLANATRVRPPP
jgi:hypothetical protein